tara:strand:+ start:285 stop:470 length:186 start_codon:yes stop_codon:yes gene_type:complete
MSVTNVKVYARKNESPENLIKRFVRKVRKEGIMEELRERMFYEKPSDKKRRLRKRSKVQTK